MPASDEIYVELCRSQLLAQSAWYEIWDREKRLNITASLEKVFRRLQRHFKTECFFEIGAHDALFSRSIHNNYPEARIYAFEANPFVYEKYSKRPAILGRSRLEYIHSAVGSQDGYTRFFLFDTLDGRKESAISKRDGIVPRLNESDSCKTIEVPVTRIDSFVDKKSLQGRKMCFWIDAEGATGQVLEGMEEVLPAVTSLFVELETSRIWDGQMLDSEIILWLRKRGFLPVLRDFSSSRQYNCIFINWSYYTQVEYALAWNISLLSHQKI